MKKYFIPVLSTAVILSLFLFLIITITYAIPLVVDDYRYLTYSQQPDFSLLSLGEFIGRVPSYAIVIYSLLKLKFLTTSFFFFYNFFFGVHVLAIGLISLYVFEATRIPIQTESRTQQIIIGIGISALSFYPNFLEVVTWPSSTIYALGGVFLALALFTKNPFVRIILFAIAFGFYETYVLPGLALVVLPYFINFEKMKFWENPDYKGFLKDVGILVISVILIYSIKHYFSSKFGSYGYPLAPASLANLDRIYSYLTVLQFQSTEFENKLELAFIGSLSVFY